MNYQQTLDYLFSRLPMFTRIGAAAFKKDLTNTIALCKVLNHPEQKFNAVHIAGTNGKGSTSHILASILQEAGYKTGLYTSPHLKDFRERIRINREMISETEVVDFVQQYQKDFERIEPSFFEWGVALCFHHFANHQVDIAIIETGLGGRLDSTNIITPLFSIITNIGWDHTDMLGDTLEKIAAEKAGIIKSQKPVIVGETQIATQSVFIEKSKQENAPITFADQTVTIHNFKPIANGVEFDLQMDETNISNLFCDLGGIYQQHNLKTVYAAVKQLRQQGFIISEQHFREGLANVKRNTGLMGRWQILEEKPLTVCDTGHNLNGIEYVVKQISMQRFNKLHIVIGMVKDKDIGKVLSLLPKDATYYFCNANIPRAMPAEELQQKASSFGLNGNAIGSVAVALAAAKKQAHADDMIFVGGSTFVVAEVL